MYCNRYECDPCDYSQKIQKELNIFKAKLRGGNEVPPNNSSANGTLIALLSENNQRLDFILHTNGLTNITGAHFHDAPRGVNGPIVKDIDINFTTGNAIGSWTSTDSTRPLTATLVNKLKRGDLYVNVHTDGFPGGEIRAQVYKIRK